MLKVNGIFYWLEHPEFLSEEAEDSVLESLPKELRIGALFVLQGDMRLRWLDPTGKATGGEVQPVPACKCSKEEVTPILSWSDISEEAQTAIIREAVERKTTVAAIISEAIDLAWSISPSQPEETDHGKE